MKANINRIVEAIRQNDIDGWLFFNFQHKDPIADKLLDIPINAVNTRYWFYIINKSGDAFKLVHSIESSILKHLPGKTYTYNSLESLKTNLKLFSGNRLAGQYSKNLPQISFLDYGTLLLLNNLNINIVSSEELVQSINLLDNTNIESHLVTSKILYSIVESTWDFIRHNKNIYEKEIENQIMENFSINNLTTNHPPIVAFGKNTGDPHYTPKGNGAKLKDNDVVQLDLWAKKIGKKEIYADISWIGIYSNSIKKKHKEVFSALIKARDTASNYIIKQINDNKPITGIEIDSIVRESIIKSGYEKGLMHRTGHSIDTNSHGWGVNLDSIEFPDTRKLCSGSCFSIEPGIYLSDFGMRTEINMYIFNNKAFISGPGPQKKLLTL